MTAIKMLTIILLGNSRRFIGMLRDIKIIIRAPLKRTLREYATNGVI